MVHPPAITLPHASCQTSDVSSTALNLVVGLIVGCIASKIIHRGPVKRVFVACAAIGSPASLPLGVFRCSLLAFACVCADTVSKDAIWIGFAFKFNQKRLLRFACKKNRCALDSSPQPFSLLLLQRYHPIII